MDFWSNFLAGVASGITISLLAVFLRRFFGSAERKFPLKLDKRTLGITTLGIIMIATVGAIIVLALRGMEIPGTLYGIFMLSTIYFIWLV